MRGERYSIKGFGRDGTKIVTKTHYEKDAITVAQSMTCPLIVPGSITRMTRKGFKASCMARQRRIGKGGAVEGRESAVKSACGRCRLGKKIKKNEPFNPPPGVKFYSLKALKIEMGKV